MTPVTYTGMLDPHNPEMVSFANVHLVEDSDDVGVALRDLEPGEAVNGVIVRAPVPRGHKLAVRAVVEGAQVRKYGWPIGVARTDIAPGDHVHTHNLVTALSGEEAYKFVPPAGIGRPTTSASGAFKAICARTGAWGPAMKSG